MFPGEDEDDLNAEWAMLGTDGENPKPVEERRFRNENSTPHDTNAEITIVHAQWFEKEPYFRVADPISGEEQTFSESEFKEYKQIAKEGGYKFQFVEMHRRIYKQAFLGKKILGDVKKGPGGKNFTWHCITGERNRSKGTWFGMVHIMKDPQGWANKWLSQTLHILNTTAKGGIVAEKDAFADMREAQDTWAQPDGITWAAKGAISNNKVMAKPGIGLPTGYINLLEFAISSIRDVTGINMELLGMRDANQPGILEAQRKQAAMTILGTLFDSLRRFRKRVGRVRLHYIQEYFSDGRLIRIKGPDAITLEPLLADKTAGRYDVIIDDAPTSPNQKQETWGMIQTMLPAIRDLLTPEAVIALLEYSPLPTQLVETFKQLALNPKPGQQQQELMQQRAALAQITLDEAKTDEVRAKAQSFLADVDMKLAEARKDNAAAVLDMAAAGSHASAEKLAAMLSKTLDAAPAPLLPFEGEGDYMIPPTDPASGGMPQIPQMPQSPPNGVPPQAAPNELTPAEGLPPGRGPSGLPPGVNIDELIRQKTGT